MSDQVFSSYDFDLGLASARPATPTVSNGRMYIHLATDTGTISFWNGTTWVTTSAGAPAVTSLPQGRVTLRSGDPTMNTDTTNSSVIFYTPWLGVSVPIYNGSVWTMFTFAEMSQNLSDTTKSPAATVASSLYDIFVWNDAGTLRSTRGPVWTNTANRGTGAGTTELIQQNGIWVNRFAITNGPAAKTGTYVGTIMTSPVNNCKWMVSPLAGAGGANAGNPGCRLDVWNMYNRILVTSMNIDNTASWAYTVATWREKNGSAGNEIAFVCGMLDDCFTAINNMNASNSTGGGLAAISIGINSATTPAAPVEILQTGVAGKQAGACCVLSLRPNNLGYNFVSPLEWSQAVGVTTWIGAGATIQSSFKFLFRM